MVLTKQERQPTNKSKQPWLTSRRKMSRYQYRVTIYYFSKLKHQKNIKTAAVKAKAKANAAKGNGGVAQPIGKGLKISFKPSELNKTTERVVASQVFSRIKSIFVTDVILHTTTFQWIDFRSSQQGPQLQKGQQRSAKSPQFWRRQCESYTILSFCFTKATQIMPERSSHSG